MSEVINIAGLVALYGVAIGVILIGIAALGEVAKKFFDVAIFRIEDRARREFGVTISRYAYWFSENPQAMELMKEIGQSASNDGNLHGIESVRDRWRKRMSADKAVTDRDDV